MKSTRNRTRALAGLVALSASMLLSPLPAMGAEKGTVEKSAANAAAEAMTVFARGAREWKENCGRCHNLRSPKEFTDKNWDVIVHHMRVIVPLPGQVARDIRAFLKASN